MFDYALKRSLDNFPLDIAMKIFWEADTIQVDYSIQFVAFGVTENVSKTLVASWGEVNQLGLNIRAPLIKATEVLCLSGFHTYREENNAQPASGGAGNHTVRRWFRIDRAPGLYEDKLFFPAWPQIEVFRSGGGGGIPRMLTSYRRTVHSGLVEAGSCNWITPWGNVDTPLFRSAQATDGSMTITVTAADPAIRYGEL